MTGRQEVTRTLVVWCPDWPVVAAGVPLDVPAAVFHANRVVACSPAARAEGVERHQRRRDAQSRCPELIVLGHDPAGEARAFEPVPAALEALTPRIEITYPGACAFPTRGPSRYHGGDGALAGQAAAVVREALAGRGPVQVGVADGPFAAALAAAGAASPGPRRARPRLTGGAAVGRAAVVRASGPAGAGAGAGPGRSAGGLRGAARWQRRLPGPPLGDRAGRAGRAGRARPGGRARAAGPAHPGRSGRPARGRGGGPLRGRGAGARTGWPAGSTSAPRSTAPPPAELTLAVEIDPPAERVEAAAFVARGLVDDLHARLAATGSACTRLVIGAETEHGEAHERVWRTEGTFTALAIADRVRWQLDGWLHAGARRPSGGLSRLWLAPDEVVPAGGRQLAFSAGAPGRSTRSRPATGRPGRWPGCRACWASRPCGCPSGGAAGGRASG